MPPKLKFVGPNLLLDTPAPPPPLTNLYKEDLFCAFIPPSVNLMLILYVREIEIKIRSCNCHVHLRHPWCAVPIFVQLMFRIIRSVLKPCQNEMQMKV